MLRLKGEGNGDMLQELDEVDHREPLPTDELTAADAFLTEPGDIEGELPLRGLAIAAATFVPTFLAVFFALPYLLGSATTVRTPVSPGPSPHVAATAPLSSPLNSDVGPDVTASLSEALRSDSMDRGSAPPTISPPVFDEPAPREPEPAPAAPTSEAASPPALPPAPSRAPEPARRAVARSEPRPTPEASKRGEWSPAAAFADREAAERLASSIQKQGYPVEVRQDGSSTRPWVVWIGAQPSGARR